MTRLVLRSASVTKDSALAASYGEPLAAGGVGRTPRGGSTQRRTPRGLDCGFRVPHIAREDSYRSICATAATARLQHHRDWSVA